MHGADTTANAPPSRTPDPLVRARETSPGASARSGIGSSPTNARPITTRMNPAIVSWVFLSTVLAIAAAPAPRITNTIVNPMMNGMLEITIRRLVPGWPSRSTSTPETAAR